MDGFIDLKLGRLAKDKQFARKIPSELARNKQKHVKGHVESRQKKQNANESLVVWKISLERNDGSLTSKKR